MATYTPLPSASLAPNTAMQFGVIQNAANSNTLVNQLYSKSPNVLAAASAVKSPNAPATMQTSTPATLPSQTAPMGYPAPASMGIGIPAPVNGMTPQPTVQPQPAPAAPPTSAYAPSIPTAQAQTQPVNNSQGTANPNAGYMATSYNTGAGTPATPNAVTDASGLGTATSGTGTPPNSFAALIAQLTNASNASNGEVQNTEQGVYNTQQQIAALQKQAADIQTQAALNEGSVGEQGIAPVALGRSAMIQNATGSQLAGIGAEEQGLGTSQAAQQGLLNNEISANQQNITGLTSAAGLAQPVTQYGALTNPQTGAAISGGATGGTLPASAQSFVQSIAAQIQSGQMTRDQGESELNAYGPAGLQALNTALGSGFNTNASNASAGTTATGQQLQTAAASANGALGTLQSLYSTLTSSTGIPLANAGINAVESLLGSSSLSSYKEALGEARAQLAGVLVASGAVTPTDADSLAQSYLPDNMTPAQLQQNIATAQTLIQQKVSSFTNSGNQNAPTNTTTSTAPAGWF